MYQIDNATASPTLAPSSAAGTPGYFTDGNPATGIAATIVPAEFLNMLMMELVNVVTGAGLTLSKSSFNQLQLAMRRYGQSATVLTDTGAAANIYSAVNGSPYVAADIVTGVTQRVIIQHANSGASTYSPDGVAAKPIFGLGLQALQGGELVVGSVAVLVYSSAANGNGGAWILVDCAGGAQQLVPATNSRHAITKGQADSLYAPISSAAAATQGAFRNLAGGASGTGASVTYTADEIVTGDGAGNYQSLRSWNGTINSGTIGPGGLDAGAVAASTWYFCYAISKPDGTKSFIASLSSTGPSLVNASGYTKWALIGAFRTDATANRYPLSFIQLGRLWQYKVAAGSNVTAVPLMASISNASMTAIAVGAYVPTALASAIEVLGSAISNNSMMLAPNSAWATTTSAAPTPKTTNAATAAVTDSTIKVRMVLESTNIYAAVSGGSGSVWCAGWELNV